MLRKVSMHKVDKELLKGSTVTIILSVLKTGEMYGYEIIKAVGRATGGAFEPKEGTVYPVLHQLERDGAIASKWREAENGRDRRYYSLTAEGKKMLARKRREWISFRSVIDGLLADGPTFREV